ncbi:TetR family transcriptional regulator [Fusobacterium animalis ATCC 51191]|uniref:TetR family transcriptional regulator n=1 Tax=Fusobacterium animalis ATCC 51191 TaxID=997347 RepID=F9EPF9_9FUSO|nr:TetR family transcriptional regulator [Fusobacterium animalis ATCC 51191]
MIFSISEVFLMMENIDFNSHKFSIKSLEEVKKSYKSGDMKEHLEFIKKSVKKFYININC